METASILLTGSVGDSQCGRTCNGNGPFCVKAASAATCRGILNMDIGALVEQQSVSRDDSATSNERCVAVGSVNL
eukprot:CAMPEP_0181532572 /NCGR_PEP_ID=MMETSP1110-20121109/72690_1 /TAXON_ID=174948 /ORGANISM="Symbiodinium sp., Strain CCMP421" /LENGTH=74 /DNA_ID=CAMNT_0023663687 /DNA_START=1 /DNA_END=222 /DNA_ORIENTATION=-